MANNQIALLAQIPQFESPLESKGKALQIQSLMNQRDIQDMDMQQRRQAIADDAGTRQVFATNDGYDDRIKALYKVNPKAALALEKEHANVGKDIATADETKAKTVIENLKALNMRMQNARDLLGGIGDKQGAATWVQGMYSDPEIGKFLTQHVGPVEQALARIPDPQADPTGFNKWRMASQLSAEKLVEMTTPKIGVRNLGNRSQTTMTDPITGKVTVTDTQAIEQSPDSVASIAEQRRAHNMADARASQTLAAGKVPSGYRANTDGSMSFIPGGPADPNIAGGKMTEDQGKATGWLIQAENAFSNMQSALKNTPSAAKPGINDAIAGIPSFGIGEAVGNSLRSADRQKFMQGSSSLSEALLRAATGAGVNKDEAAQKIRELTPVFGEADEVTKQKMAAIPLYIDSLKVRAGPGAAKAAGVLKNHRLATAPATGAKPSLEDIFK